MDIKLRSESKFIKFLDKISPDTFEVKVAKRIDDFVMDRNRHYSNFDFGNVSYRDYDAYKSNIEILKNNSLIHRIDQHYFTENNKNSLLQFYEHEIFTLNITKRRSLTFGRVSEALDLLHSINRTVKSELANYFTLIEQYFKARYSILYLERKFPELKLASPLSFNQISIDSRKTINFNFVSEIRSDTILFQILQERIHRIKLVYSFENSDIKKHEARVIFFVHSLINGFDHSTHSENQDFISEYLCDYSIFKDKFNKEFGSQKIPNLKRKHFAKAIYCVEQKINQNLQPDFFKVALLERMIDYFERFDFTNSTE